MAELLFQNRKVHYEVYGEGEPLILLNGIMMSTQSWKLFIPALSKLHQLILVDFFDQGQSEKLEGESYKQDLQVELVKALMDHLSLRKANIAGISYGSEVALQFVIKYPEYVNKLLLFNGAASTSPWLHDIGRGWVNVARTYDSSAFYQVSIPIIYSPLFYTKNLDWMKQREQLLQNVFTKPFLDAMVRLVESAEGYDVRDRIHEINVPTLIVGCEQDYLVPLHEQKYLHEHIQSSELIIIPKSGHASMYEKPTLFISLINGFIHSPTDVSVL